MGPWQLPLAVAQALIPNGWRDPRPILGFGFASAGHLPSASGPVAVPLLPLPHSPSGAASRERSTGCDAGVESTGAHWLAGRFLRAIVGVCSDALSARLLSVLASLPYAPPASRPSPVKLHAFLLWRPLSPEYCAPCRKGRRKTPTLECRTPVILAFFSRASPPPSMLLTFDLRWAAHSGLSILLPGHCLRVRTRCAIDPIL